MPQLAVETFISQYFWLLVIFFSFYIIGITKVIPRISILMKSREKISMSTIEEEKGSEVSSDLDGKFEIVKESAYGLKEGVKWNNYLGKWVSQEKGRAKNKKGVKKTAEKTKAPKKANKAKATKTSKKTVAKKK